MRFSCENCQAKYQVADEKVAGKTIRMKCRKCGHSIEVKPMAGAGEHAAGDLGATEQHPIAPPPETRLGGGIAAQSVAGASFPEPEHGMASRGAFDSQPGFERAPDSLRLALGAGEASELPAHFWYVAIGGAPVGPIALAEVIAKAREGAIHERSLAWREGLPEWQPIANVPELVEAIGPALQHAPPPRSVSGISAAPAPASAREPSRPAPAAAAPAAAPVPQSPPPAPAAAARKAQAPHTATLAATPISNELRAILDSAPDLGAPPAVAEAAPAKRVEPSTAPSPRDERLTPPPSSVRVAASAPSKMPSLVAGALAGLVVGFAAGRFTAPAPSAPAPQVSMQTAPTTPVEDKSDEVPLPPVEPTKPTPAPQAVAPRAVAPAPAAAPALRPAAPSEPAPEPAPAAPAAPARPVTASAAPPPPPMPSFGGGGGASLTEGQIAAVLSQRKVQLRRACWERIENHDSAVKVQATVSIDGSGRVSAVDATGTDAAVTGCIRQQLKEWQFPATGAPTTATLPFSFISQ